MSIEENNVEVELNKFLEENKLDLETYNAINKVVDINLLEDYLSYRRIYNLKPEDYKRLRTKYFDITNPPAELDLDLFIRHNKDRSYQSNMFLMNNLTLLIKSIKSSEDLEKTFFEEKPLDMFESTKSLTKFRKVVKKFMDNGDVPKEQDSFRQNVLSGFLKSYRKELDLTNQVTALSQDSTTATHIAKDLYCTYLFGDLDEKKVWDQFKWGVGVKSSSIVYSGFMDLVKRYPKP